MQQAVEQCPIQRSRVAPRVQHNAIDARGAEGQLHGILQRVVRHRPGGGAAVAAGRSAGGEQRQPCAALVIVQGPQLQALCFFGRDRVLRPWSGHVVHGQSRLQRHQNMGLHFQRIVQCAHQRPERFLVLALVKIFHCLLKGRAAGPRRAVGQGGLPTLVGAHRAQPDAAICSSCKPYGFASSPEGRAFMHLTVKHQKTPPWRPNARLRGLFSYGILPFSAL